MFFSLRRTSLVTAMMMAFATYNGGHLTLRNYTSHVVSQWHTNTVIFFVMMPAHVRGRAMQLRVVTSLEELHDAMDKEDEKLCGNHQMRRRKRQSWF
jgi:hypothetical protein